MALSLFAIDSMVRGYHVYKDVWNAMLDEELPCEREMDNTADRFAVAVKKDAVVVGHFHEARRTSLFQLAELV